MSWTPKRPQALAIITMAAAIFLTAIPTDTVTATTPPASTDATIPTPATELQTDGTSAAELAAVTAKGAAPIASAMGAEGPHAARAQAASGGHAVQTSTQTLVASVPASSVVVAYARSHLRAAYRSSATGPKSFDCSGLMWRVFREAGLDTKMTSQSARSTYLSYRARGLASRHDPRVGDLVVWGNGSHIGLYIGDGKAISALTTGVRVHRVRAMLTPFTAYLHTRLASVAVPAWELQVASHMGTLRHATRTVFLRADASNASASVGTLRSGLRFVVLGKRLDGAGRLWLHALTLSGHLGWVPSLASAR